jgi:hypothetical protein
MNEILQWTAIIILLLWNIRTNMSVSEVDDRVDANWQLADCSLRIATSKQDKQEAPDAPA